MGSANYVWADGSSGTKTYNCTVNPYKVNFNPNSSPCRSGLVYNQKFQPLTPQAGTSDLDSNKASTTISGTFDGTSYNEYTVSNGYRKEAGSQNVSYALSSTNFAWSDGTRENKSYSCKIDKYTMSVGPGSFKCAAGTFNASYQPLTNAAATTSSIPIGSGVSGGVPNLVPVFETGISGSVYTIANPYAINAGTYTTTFHISDSSNFKWKDGSTADITVSCSIGKMSIPVTWGTTTTFTYNGSPQAPDVSDYNSGNFKVYLERTAETDAGSYTSTATCKSAVYNTYGVICSNFNLTGNTKAYTINPAVITAPSASSYCNNLTYNGSEQTLTKSAPDHVTFTNTKRTIAGSQTITSTLESTKNYKWSDNTTAAKKFDCSIAKKSIAVSWGGNTTYTYDGASHGPSASISGTGVSGETMTLNVSDTPKTDAGSYTGSVSCKSVSGGKASCDNYALTNTTKGYTINPKPVTAPGTGYCVSRTFNAQFQQITSNPPAGVTFKYNSQIVAGKYTIEATLNSNNYKWSDGSTGKKTFDCTLSKASVAISWTTVTSWDYDGSAHSPVPTASGVGGEQIRLSYTQQTDAGSYTVTASCSNVVGTVGQCANYTLTNTSKAYTINRSKTATVGSCNSGATPNGSSALVTGGAHVTYTNNTASSTGAKTITVTANKNYAFSDGTTSKTKTCTLTAHLQKRTSTCSAGKSCAAAGCQTYNSCEHSSCGTKSCATSACGVNLYKRCSSAGCEEYNSCANSNCTCKTYNTCANSACGVSWYKRCAAAGCQTYETCSTSGCGCSTWTGKWTCKTSRGTSSGNTGSWANSTYAGNSCGQYQSGCCSTSSGGCISFSCSPSCTAYASCANSACGCKTYNAGAACGVGGYKSCATSGCGCAEYNSCVNTGCTCKTYKRGSACGVESYKTCENAACGYKSCENSSCTCKTYKTSISSCGCNTWGGWSSWTEVTSCSAGEASDHGTKTECQTVYTNS